MEQKKERIKQIMNELGLNQTEFADKTGIGKSTISLMFKEANRSVSQKSIEMILTAFPKINSDWLMFGKMPMYKSDYPSLAVTDDLFAQQPLNPQNNSLKADGNAENFAESKEMTVNKIEKNNEQIVYQPFVAQNPVSRRIDKIMIFYSDKTFENFFPEK
jgi:transcriptional regulator with XRE-family HTH domain